MLLEALEWCLTPCPWASRRSGFLAAQIASRHKVTRAAVSKRCVELTERLDLLPSRAMRSLTARKAYREAQIRRHSTYENS